MRRLRIWMGVVCWGLLAAATNAQAFTDADAVRVIGFARDQLAETVGSLSSTQFPKASRTDGTWTTVSNTDTLGWTQSFFPGSMWMMFQVAQEPLWQGRADRWTRTLENQKNNRASHDTGEKIMYSFGQAYRQTGNTYYRDVALTGAASFASRYNSLAGIIVCCDWNRNWKMPLAIDTMIAIELLLWGADNGGPSQWRQMALQHALTTLRDAVRPDGSTYHIVDYEPTTGAVRFRGTYQGYANESTWSRGQAWAIYGFTRVYRYTRDARMLEAAMRTADYYLGRLPADGVPNWDFDAPRLQKDSSAAAVVASALLELSGFVSDSGVAERYRSAALRMLDTLASPAYFAKGTNSPGLLLHGTGHLPANQEIDVSLIYGDYYFLEAILRFNPKPPYPWYSRTTFSSGTHLLGTRNTGTQTVHFDVTPRSAPIDGVVAYTDSSTPTSTFSSFNMLIRLNTSGYFDVRNGRGYRALNRVNYRAGLTYHVRMVTDLVTRRYSVWVQPPGGTEIQIANQYVFRSDAPAINDLGKVSIRTGAGTSLMKVTHHAFNAPAAPVIAGLVAEPATDVAPDSDSDLGVGATMGCAAGASGSVWEVALLLCAAFFGLRYKASAR